MTHVEKKLYNENIKQRFMDSEYSKDTQYFITYLFYKTYELESQINKDIYEMNERELESLLRGLQSPSLQAIAVRRSILANYIDWATFKEELNDTRINLLRSLPQFQGENLKEFVSKVALDKKYIDIYDLEEIVDSIALNSQDRVIVQLLWEGIKGERMCEIQNLKIDDLDEVNNELFIKSRNKKIKISSKLTEIIKDAYNEEEYNKYSITDGGLIRATKVKLKETEYIIRGTLRSKNDYLAYPTLQQRLSRVINEWDETSQVTAERIWYSGIFYYANELIKENGELTNEHIKHIMEKFNTPKHKDYPTLLKNMIKENVKKLYHEQ